MAKRAGAVSEKFTKFSVVGQVVIGALENVTLVSVVIIRPFNNKTNGAIKRV